jgi:outer membrane protein TolC
VAACSSRSPEPLIKEEVQTSAKEDFELLKESTANAPMEIDLYQALAIAIKNNRELRIQVMDSALSQGQIDVVKFDMLPKLSANAGYKVLREHPASTSVSMVTEEEENKAANDIGASPSYSVSQDAVSRTQDIGFTWNALDFGLSYVRAGQQADRYLISKELERKAIHNLTKEVIYAYWKTLSADELLAQINPLMDRVNKALDDYEYIEELLISSPMDALLYQKELLDVAQILNTQRRALMDSRAQLANLLGLMPDQEFVLVNTDNPLTELDLSLQEQEEAALFSRPELLEIRYQEKVTAAEARASMLSLFPSLTFNATWTYDSNKYLLNKNNAEYGALFGVNLLNVFQAGNINDVNKINEQIIEEQRLALSMAVLSQVHIANINYAQSLREYSNAKHYLNVAHRINELIANAQKISRFGELEVIREEASLLVARLRNDIAYAELQYSLGTLYSSVGMNFVPDNLAQVSDQELAVALEDNLNRWTKNYNSFITMPINDQNPVFEQTTKIAAGNVGEYFDFVEYKFAFDETTFYLEGSGKTHYDVELANGDSLPPWIVFLPSQYMFVGNPPQVSGSIDIKLTASNDVVSLSDTFTLTWNKSTADPKLDGESQSDDFIINQELLDELNKAINEKILELKKPLQEINEEQLDNLVAALNDKEAGKINNLIEEISDSSFVIKPKPKPSKEVVIAALEESLSNQIESLTSYSSSQSTYIQVGAFRKENVSLRIADDISNKLGTTVEVIPTLVSEPVMYRILVGPEHKDDIIETIADLMELGISDYFLTHG